MAESLTEVIQVMSSSSDSLNVSLTPHHENSINNLWQWCVHIGKRWKAMLYPTLPRQANQGTTLQASKETLGQSLRNKVYGVEQCDLHDILREKEMISWPQWHLLIDKNGKVIEITQRFHKDFENMTESSSIVNSVDKIKEIYLQSMVDDQQWMLIEKTLEDARMHNDPEKVIEAYTYTIEFSKRLNKHSAANTHHFIRLYCTILNCPTLHLTKDYIDAFTSILFHPKLKKYRVEKKTVYRGMVLDDEKPIEDYKVGATILTTAFLSTSKNPMVAKFWRDTGGNNQKLVLCTYNINNAQHCSALDIETLSRNPDEEEVLILRYVPFTITSVETEANGRINICLEEYSKEVLESNNHNSIPIYDTRVEPETVPNRHHNEEIQMSTISYYITETDANRS
jgi:hypothetical protein